MNLAKSVNRKLGKHPGGCNELKTSTKAIKLAFASSATAFALVAGQAQATQPLASGSAVNLAPLTAIAVQANLREGARRGKRAIDDEFSEFEAARFLKQATFGPNMAEINRIARSGPSAWYLNQMSIRPSQYLAPLVSRENRGIKNRQRNHSDLTWEHMVSGQDQLRQRMAYALSQIVVIGGAVSRQPTTMAYYNEILSRNALGNYRDLLEELTYSPAMGGWLTYLRNKKADPETGSVPDENYAREIMQLFTIGLVELNPDGTPHRSGRETYTNDDIIGLARVFTGLSYNDGFDRIRRRSDRNPARDYTPMRVYAEHHSPREKRFLGLTIPAGTSGEESIELALDHIFNHPNVAPFVSKQLIQRLVTSNPSPRYVQEVAEVFERGFYRLPNGERVGDGRRGDLAATFAAILFHPVARQDPELAPRNFGKVQEPILRFTGWARAITQDSTDVSENTIFLDTSSTDLFGQHPYRAPSVFNFYRPNFVAPGTQSASRNMKAPELQIYNEATSTGYANTMSRFVRDNTQNNGLGDGSSFRARYVAEMQIAHDSDRLLDRLDLLFTHGTMTDQTRANIKAVIDNIQIQNRSQREDRLARVQAAVMMVLVSPEYIVLR